MVTGPPTTRAPTRPSIILRPQTGWAALNFRELWAARELIGFLAWRDLHVRYRQTVIGVLWAIIQPLFTMIVFSIVFGHLAHLQSEGLPYPLFSYAALVPWQLFVYTVTQSGTSMLANQNLITKVYFPRLTIPLGIVLAGLVDFLIASTVLAGLMVYYGVGPGIELIFLPGFILLAVVTALGVGLLLSATAVRYRDVQYVTPFLVQLWLFATPIAYSPSIFPEPWRTLIGLNPMTGVVEGFRWSLLGAHALSGSALILSCVVALLLLVAGLFTFRRMEASFADRI